MGNYCVPQEMRVERIGIEDPARTLRTYDLSFVNDADREAFKYLPGQFCELSIPGKGESPHTSLWL